MYISNRRRDKKYGPPDLAASKEAGMQDKTEYENKVRFLAVVARPLLNISAPGFPLCALNILMYSLVRYSVRLL
jgi:hypothetical protein